jgi:hypothetical protein
MMRYERIVAKEIVDHIRVYFCCCLSIDDPKTNTSTDYKIDCLKPQNAADALFMMVESGQRGSNSHSQLGRLELYH